MREEMLFCDGGLIGPTNPSLIGGTWAWCLVGNEGLRVKCGSGVVLVEIPFDPGTPPGIVTNNHSELVAAVQALEAMPHRWSGMVLTDSNVTLLRIRKSRKQAKLNGIPDGLKERLAIIKDRLGHYDVTLLKGHPSRDDLIAGKKKGFPVSLHNVWCDNECKRQAARHLREGTP